MSERISQLITAEENCRGRQRSVNADLANVAEGLQRTGCQQRRHIIRRDVPEQILGTPPEILPRIAAVHETAAAATARRTAAAGSAIAADGFTAARFAAGL